MTRDIAIEILTDLKDGSASDYWYRENVTKALDMAIEALKAQDRPIICPRCGRTFAESEGRSE